MAAHAPPSLPDDAIVDILVRLPARSVGRCRAVCRAWRAATSLPSFDRARAELPAAVAKVTSEFAVVDGFGFALTFDFFRGRWYRGDVHRKGAESPRAVSFARAARPPSRTTLEELESCKILGSWDGVLCLQPYKISLTVPLHLQPIEPTLAQEFVLWNPLTHAVAIVPTPAGHGLVIGGYAHPVTRRFHLLHCKVAKTMRHRPQLMAPITFRIHRVGDTGWRKVPLADSSMIFTSLEDRPVSLHGNLHWPVQSEMGKVTLLVFDTTREEFRFMAAPERHGLDLETTRTVLFGGKLCVLAVVKAPSASVMEMWVLDDYSDPGTSWRLREKIRMVRLDNGADLSLRFASADAKVEVVEDDEVGGEIFLLLEGRIDTYNFREKAWRRVSFKQGASLVMHRESILQPEASFGEALRVPLPETDLFGNLCYGL